MSIADTLVYNCEHINNISTEIFCYLFKWENVILEQVITQTIAHNKILYQFKINIPNIEGVLNESF